MGVHMEINNYASMMVRSSANSGDVVTSNQMAANNQFTSDTFYELLAAQLQYQDPSESMDNTQMILQMAQFAVIEQMNNLNTQFSAFFESNQVQTGATLIGKDVTIGIDYETTVKGKVEEVGFSSSGVLVKVDGKYYESWRIIEIRSEGTDKTPDVDEPGDVPDVDTPTPTPPIEIPDADTPIPTPPIEDSEQEGEVPSIGEGSEMI